MNELVQFIKEWQTLIGGFSGGVFALGAALIVAYSAKRREETASAMLVVGDLVSFRASAEALKELAGEQEVPGKHYPFWLSEKLVWSRPTLSVLFEASVVRLMPVHTPLAAHLQLFHKIYSGTDEKLQRLSEDFKSFHGSGSAIRPPDHLRAAARAISRDFHVALLHASCAERLISDLLLSKMPTWNRLRRFLRPKPEEKECLQRLRKGDA
jgi:hypothetical protein